VQRNTHVKIHPALLRDGNRAGTSSRSRGSTGRNGPGPSPQSVLFAPALSALCSTRSGRSSQTVLPNPQMANPSASRRPLLEEDSTSCFFCGLHALAAVYLMLLLRSISCSCCGKAHALVAVRLPWLAYTTGGLTTIAGTCSPRKWSGCRCG
jgi:hypothetical protein